MNKKTNHIPLIARIGAWLLSLIAFIVGFWHAHLGLKEMRPFDSPYGSLLIASIVLLLILISYSIAISGRKIAIVFYVIGAFVFFIFNLNYFYPSYLGRKLINEETNLINEKLTSQKNKLNSISQIKESEYINILNNLIEIKENILTEIAFRGGFGSYANKELEKFKELTGSKLSGERMITKDPIKLQYLYDEWDKKLEDAILNYIATTISGDDKNKLEIVYADRDLSEFYERYNPILDSIANEDKRIAIDSLEFDTYIPSQQIKTLKIVVDKINQTDIRVNTALNKEDLPPIFSKDYPKSKHIGKFEHTIDSIRERINKIDTWGIIFICLFIDLLVPLFIYLMIRRNDETEDNSELSFWEKISGGKRPETF